MENDESRRINELLRAGLEYAEACRKVVELVGKADDFLRAMRACTKDGADWKLPTSPTGWPGPEEVSAVLKAWWETYGRLTNANRYPTEAMLLIPLPKTPKD